MTDLIARARDLIPGTTHLLSKNPDRFLPHGWPTYYEEAQGVTVLASDGRTYQDFSYFGIGACVLGYQDSHVDERVVAAVRKGVASTLNCPEEVELAEELVRLHPRADMVRLTRTAGEALAVAVRIARAHSGRDEVAVCGYHGWHDWYLAANLGDEAALDGHLLPGLPPTGVPRGLQGTVHAFHHGAIDELERILTKRKDRLAAIVMEPVRDHVNDEFLHAVRRLANEHGVTLIFDEVTSGFRLGPGGAHRTLSVEPDMMVLGKALGNGYAIAAVVGRRKIMQAASQSFISSTNWTERIGPTAALATIQRYEQLRAHETLDRVGRLVQRGWSDAAEDAGLQVRVWGLPALSHFHIQTGDAGQDNVAHTLFTKSMLERGYLASNALYVSHAHGAADLDAYLNAAGESLRDVAAGLRAGDLEARLGGPARATGFQRLT